jgi:hypothetical protein
VSGERGGVGDVKCPSFFRPSVVIIKIMAGVPKMSVGGERGFANIKRDECDDDDGVSPLRVDDMKNAWTNDRRSSKKGPWLSM